MNKKNLFYIIGMLDDQLVEEAENSVKIVKRNRIRNITLIAVAALLLFGVTAWAAEYFRSGTYSHSSTIPSYKEVPSAEILQKDLGIAPHLVEDFSNGYSFQAGYTVYSEAYDQTGKVNQKYQELHCKYLKGQDRLSLFINGAEAGADQDSCYLASTVYRGVDIKYFAYANKLVPGDYQLTEQDRLDEQAGKYVFSYGSEDISVSQVQVLSWTEDGLNYSFCVMDSPLTQEQLYHMSRELIDLQKNN